VFFHTRRAGTGREIQRAADTLPCRALHYRRSPAPRVSGRPPVQPPEDLRTASTGKHRPRLGSSKLKVQSSRKAQSPKRKWPCA
jgi:hypothetical protein